MRFGPYHEARPVNRTRRQEKATYLSFRRKPEAPSGQADCRPRPKPFAGPVRQFLTTLLILLISATALAQTRSTPADLWQQAVVYRDEWGVPHIYADTPRAMAFAFGYAQAADHLDRMLVAFREANGRAAEILGREHAASDETAIQLAHADLARHAYEFTDRITADLCEGFALGVNTWITDHPGRAPEWAEGIHPADVLALMHRVLLSQAPFDLPGDRLLHPVMPSANAWAVSPKRSANGDAMLVINPHINYDRPMQWYEAHLVTPDLDLYGATLYGLPVLLVGHNQTLGWALAPNRPDIADVYAEEPQGGHTPSPKSFKRREPAMPATVPYTVNRSRAYYVWSNNGYRENWIQQRRTPRGPIVAQADGFEMAWRVGGYTDFGAIRQLYDMGRAQSLNAFRNAIDRQQLSSFHVVYADANGNLAAVPLQSLLSGLDSGVGDLVGDVEALGGRVAALENRLDAAQTEARRGIAAAMAMASAPMPSAPGRTTWAANVGMFKSEWATGFAVAHRLDTHTPAGVSAAVSLNADGVPAARAGLFGEF